MRADAATLGRLTPDDGARSIRGLIETG
jgi:hypothetical protein